MPSGEHQTPTGQVLVCVNRRRSPRQPSCAARGSEAVADALEAALRQAGLPLTVERILCFGQCDRGPNARLAPGGRFYHGLRSEDVPALVEALREAAGNS